MRLELTLVSSINDPWLVKLVYIGVAVLLECVYFGLLYPSLIFNMFIVVYVCVDVEAVFLVDPMREKKHHHHYHHVTLPVRISLTLSRHPSLSSIGRSSRLYPASAPSCCRQVLAGRRNFARPCDWVYRRVSLMSSSSLLQQCLHVWSI